MEPRGSVLICDDDAMFAGLVRRVLTTDGWDVVGVVSMAADAIDFARVVHPGAVVMDISLAGMSGIEAIPALKEAGCTVVICSAFGSAADAAVRAGAVAVVDKSDVVTLPDVLAGLHTRAGA
ncbi:MAG: hypothetical protein NVSMB12_12470 [Acidimicrobiales bacterium]